MERRRVVVTGMGIFSPIGNSVEEAWHHAVNGISGIAPIERFDTTDLPVTFGGEVRNFDPVEKFGRREARRMDRLTHLAVAASEQAIEDAGLVATEDNCYEIGVLIGSGIGGIETILEGMKVILQKGPRSVSPLLVPIMLPDSPASKVSMMWGLRGPNMAVSTACATGNNSIGEAAEMIRRGAADAMLAGSAEAGLVDLAMASFYNMQAISRRNDDPQAASRPFDRDRDGFVVSEGAAVLILEALEHAQARGARIYAEVIGYGVSSDAFHVTAPLENGEGAQAAMRKAMKNAGLTIHDIDYINAHGTSTPAGDMTELKAIRAVFGEAVPAISSTKSLTGHSLGATGAQEAIYALMMLQDGFIGGTANITQLDPEAEGFPIVQETRDAKIDVLLSNSFGFGGTNASLVFTRV